MQRDPSYCGLHAPGPGKFEGQGPVEMTELVYAASTDGCDDQEGDVTESGWVGLLDGFSLRESPETLATLAAEYEHPNVASLYGWLNMHFGTLKAIVCGENMDGGFWWRGYKTKRGARAAYTRAASSYQAA